MADDAATVDQLQAELQELRALYAASRDENAALTEREAALAADVERSLAERATSADEQAATREILRAIASAPTDVQRVLDALVAAAGHLLCSDFVVIHRREGDVLRAAAHYGDQAERFVQALRRAGTPLLQVHRDHIPGRVMIDRQV